MLKNSKAKHTAPKQVILFTSPFAKLSSAILNFKQPARGARKQPIVSDCLIEPIRRDLVRAASYGGRGARSKKLRGRSKTTPPASNQFAMSNSLDSGVGSFEEADVGDNSCTTIDEHTLVTGQHDRETPDSFRFIYLGNAVLDKRYTQHMLPWFIAEIRRKRERNPIDLRVEEMTVKAVDCSTSATLFQHKVQTITRCARSVDKKCFAYLTKIPEEPSSSYCYVFEAVEISSVRDIFESR